MQCHELVEGHCTKLDHIHGFKELCPPYRRGSGAECRKVEMRASIQDVMPNKQVSRLDLVEPGETSLVGVAAVTALVQNLLYSGGGPVSPLLLVSLE